MAARAQRSRRALLTLVVAPVCAAALAPVPLDVWHLTDTHVDPLYVTASKPSCNCETFTTCPRVGASCTLAGPWPAGAGPFGESEADCATPPALWASALGHVSDAAPDGAPGIAFYTGDFGEAGLSVPCSPDSPARDQIVAILRQGMAGVRAALPGTRVYAVLGNHDNAPGDAFDGTAGQAWLYDNLTTIFGADFADDAAALATLAQGGFYATDAPPSLAPLMTVVALNTNYMTTLNNNLLDPASPASALAAVQWAWLNATLASLAARGRRAWLLGHIPPADAWVAGAVDALRRALTAHPGVVASSFWGHDHVDQWTLLRACGPPPPPPPPGAVNWTVTRGVQWCSGGNWDGAGDAFGAGTEPGAPHCPYVPAGTPPPRAVALCEGVCGPAGACAGFTWYPDAGAAGACCMRTSCADKPLNASSDAVCYEKAGPPPGAGCGDAPGAPLVVVYSTPSLTEGYPPTNPGLRRFTLDGASGDVLAARTYTTNLTAANAAWAATWSLEYDAATAYGLPDFTPAAWEAAVGRLAAPGAPEWAAFWRHYRKSYDGPSAEPCESGPCKDDLVAFLNGTSVAAAGARAGARWPASR